MNKLLLIIKREYFIRTQKKKFWIVTISIPLIVVIAGFVLGYMTKANNNDKEILLYDQSMLLRNQKMNIKGIRFINTPPHHTLNQVIDTLKTHDYFGILHIPTVDYSHLKQLEKSIYFLSEKNLNHLLKSRMETFLESAVTKLKMKQYQISQSQLEKIKSNIKINHKSLLDSDVNDKESIIKLSIAYALMTLITMFIMMYAIQIMRNVMEEKSSRVVEIIVSSVSPFYLMMGKIVAASLVAITQMLIWICIALIGMTLLKHEIINNPDFSGGKDFMLFFDALSQVDSTSLILVFFVYFIFGFGLYSALYAAVGSSVESDAEAQQFQLPIALPIMITFYFLIGSISAYQSVEGPIVKWLSFIPFTSPVAMLARVPYGIDFWEILVSVFILIATTIFIVFITAKIYRVGILMYGKKASIKEFIRWLKY